MPITVHQLASSLQSTSDKVIAAAKKLKIGGLSAFTELTDEEAKKIKQSFTKGSAGLLKKKETPVKEKAEASASGKATTSRLKKKTTASEEPEEEPSEGELTDGKKPAKKTAKKKTEALAAEETKTAAKKKTSKKALAEEEAAKLSDEEPAKKATKKKTTKKGLIEEDSSEPAAEDQASEPLMLKEEKKSTAAKLVSEKSASEKSSSEKSDEKAAKDVALLKAEVPPVKKEEEKSGIVRVEFGAAGSNRFPKIQGDSGDKIVKFTPGVKPADKTGLAKPSDAPKEAKGIQFLFKSDRNAPSKNWVQPKFDNDFSAAKGAWKEKTPKRLDSEEETEFVPPSKYLGIKSLKKHTKKASVVAMPQRRKDLILRKDSITVGELSELSGIKAGDLIKALMKMDLMVTMNQAIPAETAQLICMEFSVDLKVEKEDLEKFLIQTEDPKNLVLRAPVVTIMGHVDHGKTSLLDYIRKSKVAAKEAGGITQHIGAYRVANQGVGITFLDTPGHEAFTAMRARGANATDIVILVVAADDGPKPQTVEAINHAKAAGATIIVAINKCDKPGANPEKTMQLLMEHGLQADAYGGDISMVPVSAKTGQGIDELLQIITIQAELMDLKADPGLKAEGLVIESRVDKVRGVVSSLLVQKGTLKVGDIILVGHFYSRVRAMFNEFGEKIDQVLPSYPVEILGFNDLPLVGSKFSVVENEKIAKSISDERTNIAKNEAMLKAGSVNFESLFHDAKEENKKVNLNLILKADVQGSLEAIAASLNRWNNDQIDLKIIHQSVGGINSSDVSLAAASKAIIVGFNVRADANANAVYEQLGVEIKLYNIIYDLLDDIKRALEGLFDAVVTEEFLGKAEVLNLFTIPKIGMVAGCKVTEGKVLKTALVRVLRDNIVIHKGKISSLKRFKDDAKEVFSGFECGLVIDNYKNLKEGDQLEFFSEKKESVVLESV